MARQDHMGLKVGHSEILSSFITCIIMLLTVTLLPLQETEGLLDSKDLKVC